MKPARGLLLVRPVETDEARPGSPIILVADTRERMTLGQCEVIAVGAPAECDPTRSRAERKCERAHDTEYGPCPTHNTGLHPYCTEYAWCAFASRRRVHACGVRVGDWLLVRSRAFVEGPEPEKKEWFIHQDDVLAILGRGGNSNA